MFIIPLGHDKLVVEELPFATIGIIAVCLLLLVGTWGAIQKDEEELVEARRNYTSWFEAHPYLTLHKDHVRRMSDVQREIYDGQREWIAWYESAPAEVEDFLARADKRKPKNVGENMADMIALMNPDSAGPTGGAKQMVLAQNLGDDAKIDFLHALSALSLDDRAARQSRLDSLWEDLQNVSRSGVLGRFAYTPASPSLSGLLAHMFLHAGFLHFLFNMFILWLAAPKLEDRWGRLVFVGLYLLFGVAGALAHHLRHPDSFSPLIGASGAVAGLMGAFLVRYATAKIKFFYIYWLVRITPKTGVFEAPAYLMLPLWFAGEVLYGWLLSDYSNTAYFAHIGGFLTGAAVAAVFRFTDFEFRVLGKEDEVEERPEEKPLVAFQNVPAAKPASIAPASIPTPAPADAFDIHLAPTDAFLALQANDLTADADADLGPDFRLSVDLTPPPTMDVAPAAALPLVLPSFPPAAPAADVRERRRTEKYGAAQTRREPVSTPAPEPAPEPLPPIIPKEITLTGITHNAIGARVGNAQNIVIPGSELFAVTAAQIEHIDREKAGMHFPLGAPQEPGYLLAVVRRPPGRRKADETVYLMNAARCRWAQFLPPGQIAPSGGANLVLLTKLILSTFKGTSFIPGKGRVGPANLPLYGDFDEFLRHLQKATAPGR